MVRPKLSLYTELDCPLPRNQEVAATMFPHVRVVLLHLLSIVSNPCIPPSPPPPPPPPPPGSPHGSHGHSHGTQTGELRCNLSAPFVAFVPFVGPHLTTLWCLHAVYNLIH